MKLKKEIKQFLKQENRILNKINLCTITILPQKDFEIWLTYENEAASSIFLYNNTHSREKMLKRIAKIVKSIIPNLSYECSSIYQRYRYYLINTENYIKNYLRSNRLSLIYNIDFNKFLVSTFSDSDQLNIYEQLIDIFKNSWVLDNNQINDICTELYQALTQENKLAAMLNNNGYIQKF